MKTAGVIGWPLTSSLSPIFQQAALDAAGIAAEFQSWPTAPADLPARLRAMRAADCLGGCVTVPHKEAVMAHLDRLSAEAEQIGSVNWIINEGGALVGYNTDGEGFSQALQHEFGLLLAGKDVLLFGAGGAARSVIYTIQKSGASSICIVNRTLAKAERLAEEFSGYGGPITCAESLQAAYGGAAEGDFSAAADIAFDLIVNTTSVGMAGVNQGGELPIGGHERLIKNTPYVYDLVYTPQETRFMTDLSKRGYPVAGGLSMLVYQGALGFEIMTGKSAPIDVMFAELAKGDSGRSEAK